MGRTLFEGLTVMGSLGVELLPLPSFDVLRETFDYDPATGVVTWKRKIGQRAVPGKTVGTFKRHYFTVKLEGKEYILARIIWKLVHGSDPELLVDHINGNPKDNRLSNLRLASRRQNAQNRKSFKGNDACNVHQVKTTGKWRAKIWENGRQCHIGTFGTREEAVKARRQAEDRIYGEFVRR